MVEERSDDLVYGDLRVLDMAGQIGVYCGKLLADLGAEVVKVERPGGDPMRSLGPFVGDDPHPEKSLYWFQLNTSKKSITLDIETTDGKELFRKLAAQSDIIIETFPPGYLEGLGLGFEALSQSNPGLIMTSITPFGQTGPYKDFKGSDLIGVAMGGQMYLAGSPDGSPVRAGGSQGYYQASLHGAVATLIAVHHRDLTDLGQHIDVSMQQAVTLSMETAMQFWDLNKHVRGRTGMEHRSPSYGIYPCQDGFVALMAPRGWPEFVRWMNAEGHGLELADEKWQNPRYRSEHCDEADALIIPWLLEHTMDEIYLGCQERRIIAMPVNTPKELVEHPQLNQRDFYVLVEHPELGASFKYTGAPYRFESIKWRIAHRAPLIGEDNGEVFGRLGLSTDDLAALKGAGVI